MALLETRRDARRALLERLIDHAALFPPASHGMERALELHRAAQSGAERWLLGRFVCPASRLDELAEWLGPDEHLQLSIVLDDGVPLHRPTDDRLDVRTVEVSVPKTLADGEVADFVERFARESSAAAFFEVSPQGPLAAVVSAIVAYGERTRGLVVPVTAAKLRCGGSTAESFPSPEQIAQFLARCASAGVSYKATAGLHHPVRHRNPATGFTEHGFLNLLAASVLLVNDELREEQLVDVLDERDQEAFVVAPDRFGWRDRVTDREGVKRGRRFFVAYGSCSFSEPVEDLKALGVLPL